MTDTMNNLGAGGEEWRRFEDQDVYQPGKWARTIQLCRDNISKIRKREVTLRLLDRQGEPLRNTVVHVKQRKSHFVWGVNLWGQDRALAHGEFDLPYYVEQRRVIEDLLNAASVMMYWTERPKNDATKTEDQLGFPDYETPAKMVDWVNSAGLIAKGHPLFWSIPKAIPEWLKRYDYETQMKFLEVRIRSITSRFKGKIKQYDAVNEPCWEPAFKNLSKRDWPHLDPIPEITDYIEKVLGWARDEDPSACYTVNEYGVLLDDHQPRGAGHRDGEPVTPDRQLKRLIALLQELGSRGAAPNAVGLQSHTGSWGDHDKTTAMYDLIAEKTGLPCHITEFWAHRSTLENAGVSADEIDDLHFEYIKNCMICAFGNANVNAFYFWGMLKDLVSDPPYGAARTPLYDKLDQLLNVDWKTDLRLKTDGMGEVRFQAFHGAYDLVFDQSAGQSMGLAFDVPEAHKPWLIDIVSPCSAGR